MNADHADATVLVFVPALVVLLTHHEREKGGALTMQEVIEIRDSAAVMRMPVNVARAVAEKRGYPDLDPEDVWKQWQAFKSAAGEG